MFKEATVNGTDAPAHYLYHVPDGAAESPAVLFLHGGLTYVYPETLWWEIRTLLHKNDVARERFVVIVPFATAGEPLAVVSSTRRKADRFGNDQPYVDDFHDELVWTLFLDACRALGEGCVDFSRLYVIGYSMGAQSAWNIMGKYGSQLAAAAVFAGCCSWQAFGWDSEDIVFENLRHLAVRSYHVEADSKTYSWRDFQWLAEKRGMVKVPVERAEAHVQGMSLKAYCWDDCLQLNLMQGTASAHCCWDEVLHNEGSFKLFSWLESHKITGLRQAEVAEQWNHAVPAGFGLQPPLPELKTNQPESGGSTGRGEPSDITCRRLREHKKLKNRSLTRDEAHEHIVRSIAKVVLQDWYSTGYSRANALMPRIQIDDNLKKVASIPGWQEEKGLRNGYVMLLSSLSGRRVPVILQLEYGTIACGGITYRQLHHQVRAALQLEPKHSLRMCPFRPWYRHMTGSIPVPEKRALPASDGQCRHLLGTTLWYYCYVHLH